MADRINFGDRDWLGQLIARGDYGFTSDANDDTDWTQIQVGGNGNSYPVIAVHVSGEATSPASLGSNPDDRILYLEIKHVPRGAGSSSGSGVTTKIPILKWKDGETSTEKEIAVPIQVFLNTDGIVDGNMFARIVSESSGITFTGLDINLSVFGNYTNQFSLDAPVSTTNNLYSTAVNAACNTVNELPASTSGYIECDFTQYGHFGDTKTGNKVGLSLSSEVGSDPKYYWDYHEGDGTGNTPLADAIFDGTVVVNSESCAEGDTLRVERNGSNNIVFKKNGTTLYTGTVPDSGAMKGDIKLTQQYGRALGIRMDIGAGEISPTFENKSNITEF